MTEAEAKFWLKTNFDVSRETMERLELFAAFLQREAQGQNLISASTIEHIWSRHIVDSAQLLKLIPTAQSRKNWLDLGTGAGFPGVIIAILSQSKVTLVESRGRRIDYLQRAVTLLNMEAQIDVAGMALERLGTAAYSVISARAFAPLSRLFELAERFSTAKTLWLLPKGRIAAKELKGVELVWDSEFRIVDSVTDPEAGILVGHLNGKRSKSAEVAKRQHRR